MDIAYARLKDNVFLDANMPNAKFMTAMKGGRSITIRLLGMTLMLILLAGCSLFRNSAF